MKILLVRPRVEGMRWQIVPSIGLGYISAALKKHGHETRLLEAWVNDYTPKRAAELAPFSQCDVVGIQVFYNTVDWVRGFILMVKEIYRNKPLIVVGGPHVSVMGLPLVESLGANVGVRGEAEEIFPEWLSNIDPYVKTSPRLIESQRLIDVNEYPMPDWEFLNLPQYWPFMTNISVPTKGKRIGIIHRSRGCNYPCTFCAGHVTMGRVVRIRDTENVMQEIEYLRSRYDINEIWFQDDNALKDKEKSIELLDALTNVKLPVRLPVGVRVENIDHEMVHLLRAAGVYFAGVGIESGNRRVLRQCKKLLDLDKTRNAIALLDEHGIRTSGYFILGLPTAKLEEEYDTLKYALSTQLSCAQFGIFNPLPGSEDEHGRSLLSDAELTRLQRNFTLRFALRFVIIFRMLCRLRMSQLTSLVKHPWILAWFGIKDTSRITGSASE